MVKRASLICSNNIAFKKEIQHIKHIFKVLNNYPEVMVENVVRNEIENKEKIDNHMQSNNGVNEGKKELHINITIWRSFR